MRYKLTLKLADPNRNILPVNYQFELGAWLYRLLNRPQTDLRGYLTANGYQREGEPFRHFVFSHLAVPNRKIEGDRLQIGSENISFIFSTIPDEQISPLVQSIFFNTKFLLGDRISQVAFQVVRVDPLSEPPFNDKMTFRTLSPLLLTQKVEGRKNEQFLSPETPGYALLFFDNLREKYRFLSGHEHPQDSSAGKFKLRSPVTQKGITIQSGNPGQSKLIGFQLRFRLHADPALIRAGYYLGFGDKNHLGFGCCDHL